MENRTLTVCQTLQRIYRRGENGEGHTQVVITTPKHGILYALYRCPVC